MAYHTYTRSLEWSYNLKCRIMRKVIEIAASESFVNPSMRSSGSYAKLVEQHEIGFCKLVCSGRRAVLVNATFSLRMRARYKI